MKKKQLLFVINPISGGKSKDEFPQLIKENLNTERFDYRIFWWNKVEELPTEVNTFIDNGGDVIVAVGGDGTINNTARLVANTSAALAIVPMGSGNGLARELEIPLNPAKAIRKINEGKEVSLDVGFLNNGQFVNVAGWGFDAQVSVVFAGIEKRGFWSYVKAIVKEYRNAKNFKFTIDDGSKIVEKEAFMLTVANGTQWGNDFFVAPDASYSDGLLDLVFLKKPGLHHIPGLVLSLYRKKEHQLLSRIRVKEVTISCNESVYTHLDGEPHEKFSEIRLSIREEGLQVFI